MSDSNDVYETMRAIGRPYGLTSHDVGNLLAAAGYRTKGGKPTALAHERNMVRSYQLRYGGHDYQWHTASVHVIIRRFLDKRRKMVGGDE
jgi:hypothetical protein